MTFNKHNIDFPPTPIHPNFKDVTGRQYGYLTVIGFGGREKVKTFWWCECQCGKTKRIAAGLLQSQKTTSCGCRRVEVSTQASTTHGMRNTPEYKSYAHAKERCLTPTCRDYTSYGARGIEFRFNSFEEFFDHIGKRPTPKHSLDRIDVNGHYEVGNVRWATHKEQSRNTRKNRYLTFNGKTQLLIEWSEETGISPSNILNRLKAGWSIEKISTTPSRPIKTT